MADHPDFLFTTKIFRGFTHEKEAFSASDAGAFRAYLDPLMEAGRLGAVLLQFPWSFKNSPQSFDKLTALFHTFDAYPKALEVRHASFQNRLFADFLEEHGVSWVNVDQPLFNDSVEPADAMTGSMGYVRFHGRNYEKWFTHEEAWERYSYLYSKEELQPWVERIETMAQSKDVFVITNNHFRGQGIVNAGDLKQSLGLGGSLPPQLREVYGDRVPE